MGARANFLLELLLYVALMIALPVMYASSGDEGASKSTVKFVYQEF